jgi:hypothetical protein
MINVIFPPGCYGTYVARCIYNYTNLRKEPYGEFTFNNDGNSHQHWDNLLAKSTITQVHIETFKSAKDDDIIVSILPCTSHRLDYVNNQFVKQQHRKLIKYISLLLEPADIEYKLATHWNYHGKFDETVPRWIMREWCSFWINDLLEASYNPIRYQELNSVAQLTTQDIFENYIERLTEIVSKLELTFTIDLSIIHQQHVKFLSLQKLHNSQLRCEQYVHNLLDGNNNEITVYSIFDEAYIQHLLRLNNLELQCNGLDLFPTTTQQLRNLTYEKMHNTN